jgi:hypothetical protein
MVMIYTAMIDRLDITEYMVSPGGVRGRMVMAYDPVIWGSIPDTGHV